MNKSVTIVTRLTSSDATPIFFYISNNVVASVWHGQCVLCCLLPYTQCIDSKKDKRTMIVVRLKNSPIKPVESLLINLIFKTCLYFESPTANLLQFARCHLENYNTASKQKIVGPPSRQRTDLNTRQTCWSKQQVKFLTVSWNPTRVRNDRKPSVLHWCSHLMLHTFSMSCQFPDTNSQQGQEELSQHTQKWTVLWLSAGGAACLHPSVISSVPTAVTHW